LKGRKRKGEGLLKRGKLQEKRSNRGSNGVHTAILKVKAY
jgi:hypothetical protein